MKDFNDSLLSIVKNNQEPSWLKSLRLDALHRFENTPNPPQNHEEWRRINLNEIFFSDLTVPSKKNTIEFIKRDWDNARHFTKLGSSFLQGKVPEDVFVGSLNQAALDHPDLIRSVLEKSQDTDTKYPLLTNALWNGSVFIYVPPNKNVTVPVAALLSPVSSALPPQSEARASFFPKTVVLVEENSSLTFIMDQTSGLNWNGWMDSVTDFILKPNAHLNVLQIQRIGTKATALLSCNAHLEKNSSLNLLNINRGCALSKSNWKTEITGEGASAKMFGLLKAQGTQHFNQMVHVSHQSPHTESNVLFKTALADQSRSMFQGLIHVRKEAQKTNAYQSNRNLLLNRSARADTIPKLEIEANDVRCGHGAVVSSLDEDQMYYLMTRGLEKSEAQNVLIEGFYEDVAAQWLGNDLDPTQNREENHAQILNLIHKVLFSEGHRSVLAAS